MEVGFGEESGVATTVTVKEGEVGEAGLDEGTGTSGRKTPMATGDVGSDGNLYAVLVPGVAGPLGETGGYGEVHDKQCDKVRQIDKTVIDDKALILTFQNSQLASFFTFSRNPRPRCCWEFYQIL